MSNFREFFKTTEEIARKPIPGTALFNEYPITRYHVQLGTTHPVVYSTDSKCTDIRKERNGVSTPVTADELAAKPWILQNLQEEVAKQRKKEREAMYAKDCFQRTPYSANQRIAYHNSNSNKGL
ncbi:hypothetical protein [Acinetobacter sp. ANC5681]|uniref:hypothetical protein n=1 Tax=Acinetobacter sp. ANC5681 TaxID=2929504 RepID=UPI00201B209E|nr:hypothetical protein [Acinetobacter sp. ANC5681]MCL5769652.1 hypothetical protein [Acinetobacter sp. ANC5681]